MKKLITLLSLGILTMLFAGCATVAKGPNQAVDITSNPSGAVVKVNGLRVGETPMTAKLSRKRAHTVELEKAHFQPASVQLLTVPNDAADSFVRFGIDDLMGAHTDLSPGEVHVDLDPVIIPAQAGDDPVSELVTKILMLDEYLSEGEIRDEDHRYITRRLIQFYQQ